MITGKPLQKVATVETRAAMRHLDRRLLCVFGWIGLTDKLIKLRV